MTAYKTLVIIGSDYTYNTGFPLAGGSSPSIAASSDGTVEVAFEASSGHLWTYNSASGGSDTGLPMVGGSTPSIAALAGGGYESAYVANTGQLAFAGAAGTGVTGYSVRGASNPTIAAESGSGYVYAFQDTSGQLQQGASGLPPIAQHVTLAAGTSPSIVWLSTGVQVAYELSSGLIGWSGPYTGSGPASVGSSSPSISPYPGASSGFRIGYQSTGFQLAFYDSSYGVTTTGLGMAGTGTGPSSAG